jgi:hypothetical protein
MRECWWHTLGLWVAAGVVVFFWLVALEAWFWPVWIATMAAAGLSGVALVLGCEDDEWEVWDE